MRRPTPVRGYLIDVEGVLVRDKRYEPLPGAADFLTAIQAAGRPFCLVSNNTTERPEELEELLRAGGLPLPDRSLITALGLARRYLRERGRQRLMWLGKPSLKEYWEERGFDLTDSGVCDAVVLAAWPEPDPALLNTALEARLEHGAHLVCLHRNPWFIDSKGFKRLGPGAWAAALETAGGSGTVSVVGKPDPLIYHEGLDRIGVPARETLFISDDPVHDLRTAGAMGMITAFVLSGKFPDQDVLGTLEQEHWPDLILDGIDQTEIDAGPNHETEADP